MSRPHAVEVTVRAIDVASERLVERNLASGKYVWVDGELYKRCTTCRDHWPADTEFFYGNNIKKGDGLWYQCKARYLDRRYPNGRTGNPQHDLH